MGEKYIEGILGGGEIYEETGVTPDYINAWTMIGMMIQNATEASDDDLAKELAEKALEFPVLHYEEYIRKHRDSNEVDSLIQGSDPEKVKEINLLVDAFNDERERIRKEKDYKRAAEYFSKISDLVRGKDDTPVTEI